MKEDEEKEKYEIKKRVMEVRKSRKEIGKKKQGENIEKIKR